MNQILCGGVQPLGVLSMELISCHASVTWNFEVTVGKICAPLADCMATEVAVQGNMLVGPQNRNN